MKFCKWLKNIFKKKEEIIVPVFISNGNIAWDERESILLNRINEYRNVNGKSLLLKDDKHYVIAYDRNMVNLTNENISHDWFYSKVRDVLSSVGVYKSAENLSYGYRSINGVFYAWTNSKPHREVILGDWNYTGLSIEENENGRFYACQIFGR